MRLSEAIRLGSLFVIESRNHWMWTGPSNTPCGCALGTAAFAAGHTWEEFTKARGNMQLDISIFAKWFPQYPEAVLREVSIRHTTRESRPSIAQWVEIWEKANLPKDDLVTPLDECIRQQEGGAGALEEILSLAIK